MNLNSIKGPSETKIGTVDFRLVDRFMPEEFRELLLELGSGSLVEPLNITTVAFTTLLNTPEVDQEETALFSAEVNWGNVSCNAGSRENKGIRHLLLLRQMCDKCPILNFNSISIGY